MSHNSNCPCKDCRFKQNVAAVCMVALIVLALIAAICRPAKGQGFGEAGFGNAQGHHCNLDIQKHVYHASRLKVLSPCIEARGTVILMRKEKDGDIHTQLKLDPGQEKLLNARNISVQHGALVVEPMCVGKVTQADAIAACKNWHQGFADLKMGAHVRVVGPWVTDNEANHGWNEIHGPTTIEAIK